MTCHRKDLSDIHVRRCTPASQQGMLRKLVMIDCEYVSLLILWKCSALEGLPRE